MTISIGTAELKQALAPFLESFPTLKSLAVAPGALPRVTVELANGVRVEADITISVSG